MERMFSLSLSLSCNNDGRANIGNGRKIHTHTHTREKKEQTNEWHRSQQTVIRTHYPNENDPNGFGLCETRNG